MAKVNNAKKLKVRRRDNDVCGKHLGGCQRKLTNPKEMNIDHIIPKSYFRHLTTKDHRGYNAAWNLQLMCVTCNRDKRGQLLEWPLFRCRCHYLHIDEKGQMWVRERTGPQEKRHFLMEDVVDEGVAVKFRGVVGRHTDPHGVERVGFSDPKGSCPPIEMGHCVAGIHRSDVEAFNWFERVRVSLAETGVSCGGASTERYILLPNGNIHTEDMEPIGQFDVAMGHGNIYVLNSFLKAKQ